MSETLRKLNDLIAPVMTVDRFDNQSDKVRRYGYDILLDDDNLRVKTVAEVKAIAAFIGKQEADKEFRLWGKTDRFFELTDMLSSLDVLLGEEWETECDHQFKEFRGDYIGTIEVCTRCRLGK